MSVTTSSGGALRVIRGVCFVFALGLIIPQAFFKSGTSTAELLEVAAAPFLLILVLSTFLSGRS
jgi:hypothetical protein